MVGEGVTVVVVGPVGGGEGVTEGMAAGCVGSATGGISVGVIVGAVPCPRARIADTMSTPKVAPTNNVKSSSARKIDLLIPKIIESHSPDEHWRMACMRPFGSAAAEDVRLQVSIAAG